MHRSWLRIWCLVLCHVVPATGAVAAQQASDQEQPRVERVVFRGVQSVDRAELERSIHTQGTRCRSLLAQPFCWATSSSLWEEKHYLDPLEVRRDELRIRVFYFRRGFRETEVTSEVQPRGRVVRVVFTVNEGPPTTVRTVEVVQAAEVLDERHVERARLPRQGEPLNLLQVDSALIRLREALGEEGYLDAQIRDTILVEPATRTAAVQVTVEPGRTATVGEIQIQGNERVEEGVIRTALDMRPGDVLRHSELRGSQRNLYESNLFRLAQVVVPPQEDSAKVVQVTVREAPPRTLSTSVGLNTVDFVQTEVRYTNYNFGGGGKLFDAQATVGNLLVEQLSGSGIFTDVIPRSPSGVEQSAFHLPTWQASLTLSQPGFQSNLANTVSGSVFAHRRVVPGIAIDRGYGVSGTYTRELLWRTPASLNYRLELTAVEAGDVYFCLNYGVCDPALIDVLRDDQRLSPLILTSFSNRADNPLIPTTGFRARLDLEHASAVTLSDFRYHRATGEYARYLPVGEGRVLAGRIRAGWVRAIGGTGEALGISGGDDLLHPRKRFYAGGARSVRGFGENQLGPRILTVDPAALMNPERGGECTPAALAAGSCDPSGVPSTAFEPRALGGTQMLEANLEFRFPLWRSLVGAAFVDAGWVGAGGSRIRSEAKRAITPGFGFRYTSPVGPIRVDLGMMPTGTEELPVVTEIVDQNGERRIIQLDALKMYDPLEGLGGVRKVLRRLTLHLSIGQAF